jgi:hypothetical protein
VTSINSGSSNTGGFQIVVEKTGKAEYRSQPRRIDKCAAPKVIRKMIPKSSTERLYLDVMAARPLTNLLLCFYNRENIAVGPVKTIISNTVPWLRVVAVDGYLDADLGRVVQVPSGL